MPSRLRYPDLAPAGVAAMRALEHYCNAETLLSPVLLELVRLRASHLNGCEYCVAMHTHELEKHNETPGRIAHTAHPAPFDGYTLREQAALRWTDAITNIQNGHASDVEYAAVREHFNETDLVNLTLAIVSINSWNRMAIAFHSERHSGAAAAASVPTATATPNLPNAEPATPESTAKVATTERSAVADDGGKVAVD